MAVSECVPSIPQKAMRLLTDNRAALAQLLTNAFDSILDTPLKTIELGRHAQLAWIMRELKEREIQIDMSAQHLLQFGIPLEEVRRVIELQTIHPADLGVKAEEGISLEELRGKVLKSGYRLCPQQTALDLRLQYLDQKVWETLIILSEPVGYSEEDAGLFALYHDGRTACMGISGVRGHSKAVFYDAKFVVVRS